MARPKSLIGRLPLRSAERLFRTIGRHVRSGATTNLRVMDALSTFYPASFNYWRFPELTFTGANDLPARLLELHSRFRSPNRHFTDTSSHSFATRDSESSARELADSFQKHGSDKSEPHDYHRIYAEILTRLGREASLDLLEIGIGTNDPAGVSTMGASGQPGASLRAFRDFLPNARVFGADIDDKILFREERIATAVVDQLRPESFEAMVETLGCSEFDLIIDDGLHSVDANINGLLFAASSLRAGGWYVVEDIPDRTAIVWGVIGQLIADRARLCHLVRCQAANVFAVQFRGATVDESRSQEPAARGDRRDPFDRAAPSV